MNGFLATATANRVMTVPDLNIPDPPDGADPLTAAGFEHRQEREQEPPITLIAPAPSRALLAENFDSTSAGAGRTLSTLATDPVVEPISRRKASQPAHPAAPAPRNLEIMVAEGDAGREFAAVVFNPMANGKGSAGRRSMVAANYAPAWAASQRAEAGNQAVRDAVMAQFARQQKPNQDLVRRSLTEANSTAQTPSVEATTPELVGVPSSPSGPQV
jgi:hypothetical protein